MCAKGKMSKKLAEVNSFGLFQNLEEFFSKVSEELDMVKAQL